MLQEKTARKPDTLRAADVAYVHAPGRVLIFFSLLIPGMAYVCTRMYERESTAPHSSTAKTIKVKPKMSGSKKSPSSLV